MTTKYGPQSDDLPRQVERVDEKFRNTLDPYPSHVRSYKVDSEQPIEGKTVELWAELEQDVRPATVEKVFERLYLNEARERLGQDFARALYDELGFDEGREGVVACYAIEPDLENFMEADGEFFETEDRFIFPWINGNEAKVRIYSGIVDDIYEERVVNGETALVNVGGERREWADTQEMQWDGADFLIGQQEPYKWAGDSEVRAKFLAMYLDELHKWFENQ